MHLLEVWKALLLHTHAIPRHFGDFARIATDTTVKCYGGASTRETMTLPPAAAMHAGSQKNSQTGQHLRRRNVGDISKRSSLTAGPKFFDFEVASAGANVSEE